MNNFDNFKQSFSLGNLPLDFSSIFDKVGRYNLNPDKPELRIQGLRN